MNHGLVEKDKAEGLLEGLYPVMVHSPCHTEYMGPYLAVWTPPLHRLMPSPVQVCAAFMTSTYMMALAEPFHTKPTARVPWFLSTYLSQH